MGTDVKSQVDAPDWWPRARQQHGVEIIDGQRQKAAPTGAQLVNHPSNSFIHFQFLILRHSGSWAVGGVGRVAIPAVILKRWADLSRSDIERHTTISATFRFPVFFKCIFLDRERSQRAQADTGGEHQHRKDPGLGFKPTTTAPPCHPIPLVSRPITSRPPVQISSV